MAEETVFEDAVARVERIGREANVGGEVIEALGPTNGGLEKTLRPSPSPRKLADGSVMRFECVGTR